MPPSVWFTNWVTFIYRMLCFFQSTCYIVKTFVLINLCCTACVLMLKRWVCWKYQFNEYRFNFIDHLHFYSCECCVGRDPNTLLCPGTYYAVKTDLNLGLKLGVWQKALRLSGKSGVVLYLFACGTSSGMAVCPWIKIFVSK